MLWIFFCTSLIFMCKLIYKLKLKTAGLHPSDFRLSGVTCEPEWSVWLHWRSPQKTESSLQPVGSSRMTESGSRPAICLSDSNMTVIISPQRNPILWHGIGKLWPTFLFCFPHPHTSLPPPSPPSSLAWYLGHEGAAFSKQRPRAYCPLAPSM